MTTASRRYYGRSQAARPNPRIAAPQPQHKYKVGQEVRYLRGPSVRLTREVEKSLFMASFEVSRLLPASGTEFQYRLKNLTTGQERIAGEAEIVLAGE